MSNRCPAHSHQLPTLNRPRVGLARRTARTHRHATLARETAYAWEKNRRCYGTSTSSSPSHGTQERWMRQQGLCGVVCRKLA
jgi:hypothetical protein